MSSLLASRSTRRPVLALAASVAAAAFLPRSARAQAGYPNRPIRMVMPFAAGSGFDNIVRITCLRMGEELGQQIVVDNQPGAGGIIASAAVSRAAPDGYTLIYQSVSTAVVLASVYTNLRYEPIKGFAPISLMSQYPLAMVLNPSVPARSVAEFSALLKSRPNAYSYGSSGIGTGLHLAGELYKMTAGVSIEHIPYKGTAPAEQDLIAGRTHMMFAAVPSSVPRIAAGQLRPIGVSTLQRSPALPEVPTLIESGLAGFNVPFWNGIYGPAGLPRAVVDRLAAAAARTMRDASVIARLKDLGADSIGSTPEELDKFWKDQLALYSGIAERAKVKLEAPGG